MRRDDRVDPEILEPGDEVEHFFATIRIESGGRLIEQHQFGIVDDRLGEFRPLLHAGGKLPDIPEPFFMEADEAEDVAGALARGARRQAAEFGGVPEEVGGGLVGRQTVALGHPAHAAADLDGAAFEGVPEHPHRAGRRGQHAEQDLQQGRLASTVGSDEPNASLWNRQIDTVDGNDVAVGEPQSADRKNVGFRRRRQRHEVIFPVGRSAIVTRSVTFASRRTGGARGYRSIRWGRSVCPRCVV